MNIAETDKASISVVFDHIHEPASCQTLLKSNTTSSSIEMANTAAATAGQTTKVETENNPLRRSLLKCHLNGKVYYGLTAMILGLVIMIVIIYTSHYHKNRMLKSL
ncbi:DgyrCDS14935 [Dimorphilus gyrociliatus]|uniref:DgyrCDS14935 n=1 Tax=Dimorphilus gyrociliatus TaxID=2664684 RepID=A0A7I8WFP0_9ANNE|nr:DgyrCDS14935 [Dimorphilus gyrociliatus]